MISRLPEKTRSAVIERMIGNRGVSSSLAGDIDPEEMNRWILGEGYGDSEGRRFPYIFIGAPSGAAAFLSALYRCPLLTDRFLISFKSHNDPDDAAAYAVKGSRLWERVCRNGAFRGIVHFDPLHDRFLIRQVVHLRFRLLRPLDSMKEFIRERLADGGRLVLLQCRYEWPQYTLEDDLAMQIGGLGGINAEEFTSSSPRLHDFRVRSGGKAGKAWKLEGSARRMPESEWGSEPGFTDALKTFCIENGIGLSLLDFEHPHALSELVLRAYMEHFTACRQKVRGVYVGCFTNIDACFPVNTGLLPLWLPFNCEDSHQFLVSMTNRLRSHWEVWVSLHPSFCRPPDLVGIRQWRKALEKFSGIHWLGTDPDSYPADVMSYVRFHEQTKRLSSRLKKDIPPADTLGLLSDALNGMEKRVSLEEKSR